MTDEFDKSKFGDPIYEPLRPNEREWLERSRSWASVAARAIGESGKWTGSNSDWDLVQRLIDENAFDKTSQGNWEGLAVVCGDVLANKLSLVWKRVTDGYGTTVVLQFPETAITVYVCSTLWKRIERSEEIDTVYLFSEIERSVSNMIDSGDYMKVFDKQ